MFFDFFVVFGFSDFYFLFRFWSKLFKKKYKIKKKLNLIFFLKEITVICNITAVTYLNKDEMGIMCYFTTCGEHFGEITNA